MVLPADFAHLVFQQHFALKSYQLPRVPSLFPDLLVYVPLQLATGSWRLASFSMGFLHLFGLVLGGGLIVRQISGARLLAGSMICLLLTVPICLCEIAERQFYAHLHLIEQLVSHSGEFVVSLFAAGLAAACLRQPRPLRLVLLCCLSLLCFLSDKLTLFEWHLPLVAASVPLLGTAARRNAIKGLAAMLAGLALAMIFDQQLLPHILDRAADIPIDLSETMPHLRLWLADLSLGMTLGWMLPVTMLFGGGPMIAARLKRVHRDSFLFYWRFALASMITPLLVVSTLLYHRPPTAFHFVDYVEITWYRYCDSLFWWPVIIAASLASAAPWRRLMMPAVFATPIFLAVPLPHFPPLLATWRPAIADCLTENRALLGNSSGLAGYWNARSVAAALEWAIEIDQIAPDGHIFFWANDRLSYRARPGKPAYGFVILKGLDSALIRQNYGAPDGTLSCPGSEVWIYRDAHLIDQTPAFEPAS